jgi:beta-galactosidase
MSHFRSTILLFFAFFQLLQVNAWERVKYNFNASWKLHVGDLEGAEANAYNDADWKSITLPYAWNQTEAFLKPIHEHSTSIAWYRKNFKLDASLKGQKVFLEMEGIRFGGEFYLNGKFIGRHENGVMAFGFDISNDVFFGDRENVIAVKTDNSWSYREKATNSTWQWNNNNFNANYGGIPKNAWLHVTSPVYQTLPLYSNLKTTGTYLYAQNIDIKKRKADFVASSEVKNETQMAKSITFEVEVTDGDGKTIKVFSAPPVTIPAGETKILSATSVLNELNFWSWGYGYLYTVATRLKEDEKILDEVKTQTGFRKTAFKDGMVYLNDQVLMMKGYAQRTSNEWPAVGMSVPPWLSDYSNHLMVESNANLVRWMHVAPWKQDVESCDRVGLIQAMPAGDAEKDVEGRRWEQRVELMRDAIIYNRNSPSILFYESGNESISEDHMIAMRAVRDQYDPHGGRAVGSREMLDSKNSEYGGEMLYINKSDTQPLWSMEYSRDEGLRKYWDEFTPPYHKNGAGPMYKNQDASDYNRNQDSHAIENIIRWAEYWDQRPGTGKRVSSGGVNIIFSDSNTHYRGEENYRRSGEVDAMRLPKDGFYAHQVMWDGWVNPDKKGLHIIGHWNYKAGVVKDQYVVAAGDKVELLLNGKSLGYGKQSYHFLFTFENVNWQPGELKAISYDKNGKKLAEKTLQTAGEPTALRLSLKQAPQGLKADGADMVLVEVEVIDEQGQRCLSALNRIDFKLDGPAEWLGGIAQGPDNYILSASLPVECGVNRVLIRSTTVAGNIALSASSAGLKSAQIGVKSIPVTVSNGLSLDYPNAGLSSRLDRGPTPAVKTYEITRVALPIKNVTAGAHQEKAAASYDNNELSSWTNDGKLSTAWITYELQKAEKVSQVVLKLNGFRTKTYPLKIFVDEELVFDDHTRGSLGYFTAICKPHKGKKVKIMLASESRKDGKELMEEMGGKKLDDGLEQMNANAKGALGIIETEIYREP